jgi:hypothetical protein
MLMPGDHGGVAVKFEQTAADKGGMTLDEIEAWVTTLRAQGAAGKVVPRARVSVGGRLKAISAEVSGASPLYGKRPPV